MFYFYVMFLKNFEHRAMLLYTNIKLDLTADVSMYQMLEKGMGGLAPIINVFLTTTARDLIVI